MNSLSLWALVANKIIGRFVTLAPLSPRVPSKLSLRGIRGRGAGGEGAFWSSSWMSTAAILSARELSDGQNERFLTF